MVKGFLLEWNHASCRTNNSCQNKNQKIKRTSLSPHINWAKDKKKKPMTEL